MLQSLKPKVVKDLKSQRFSKVKVYHKHKANQIGVHATQGHMETHTHIVCFRSYYCNYYSTPHSEWPQRQGSLRIHGRAGKVMI